MDASEHPYRDRHRINSVAGDSTRLKSVGGGCVSGSSPVTCLPSPVGSSEIRLRIVRAKNGGFYVQVDQDGERLSQIGDGKLKFLTSQTNFAINPHKQFWMIAYSGRNLVRFNI